MKTKLHNPVSNAVPNGSIKWLLRVVVLMISSLFLWNANSQAQSGERCFTSSTYPSVYAKSVWSTNGDTVTIRTTLSRSFVDNTYGTSIIGWPGTHKFGDLTGSDFLQIALFNNANTKILEFKMDYFTSSSAAPSGYKSLGVTGGDGGMLTGSATNVYGVTTSMDVNFNTFGYVLTTNSPVTDTNYTANPTYPDWIYSVWYEVKVNKNAFGVSGFFQPNITGVHASPSKVGTNSVTVTPGPCPLASIGDQVWSDSNNNGVQDAGEPGVSGVSVKLYSCADNTLVGTTTTNASGNYAFNNLPIETSYYVVFDPTTFPAGFSLTSANQGTNDALDSDADPSTGQTVCEYLTAHENNTTYDAGLYNATVASIGNFVWDDIDEDGIQDATEPGVNGMTVELYTCGGTLVSSTTTTNGSYGFANLAPGSYYVKFILPSGASFTAKNAGSNSALDSDADPVTGQTVCENLVAGENNTTYDAGIKRPIEGERCFISPSLPGTVFGKSVWTSSGDTITIRTTLARTFVDNTYGTTRIGWPGNHSFGDLTGSDKIQLALYDNTNTKILEFKIDYITSSSAAPSGYKCLGVTGGDGGMILGSATNIFGATTSMDVNFNTFGYVLTTNSPATDTNYTVNPTYPNWIYTVWYEVKVRKSAFPAGFSVPDITDCHASPSKVGSNSVPVDPGPCPVGSIGDRVWNDLNNNGVQDAGENGVAGVTVRLYTCLSNTAFATTVTDANGNYLFPNLEVDVAYYVEFDLSTAPAGAVFSPKDAGSNNAADSDADPVTGRTICENITINENNLTYDAGIYIPVASLGDFVWHDTDGDGIQDPGEPGISGATVRVYTCGGTLVATTTTNASGGYLFANLAPGSYFVEFVAPSGYVFSAPNQGGDDSKDSDADPVTGRTGCETLIAGENNTTYDAGLYQPASLGDFVWEDLDGDGIQDPGEPGFSGATVNLYNCLGTLVATTTTNANGAYLFTGLPPGSYYVQFSLPTGYAYAPFNAGSNDTQDSDANPANGQSPCVTLNSGDNNTTVDAGIQCIAPAAPNLNVTQPTCLVSTGTITVTSPVGAGFTYSLNGGTYQSSTVFSGLSSGSYTVRAKNAINCVSTTTSAVINPQPPTPPTAVMSVVQPSCHTATGSITILSPVGAGLTYSINGVNYQAGTTFSSLAPGTYNVTVKNSDNCISANSPVTINPQPITPSAPTVSITQPTCVTATGSITITSPLGAGLSYSLNGVNYQAGSSFSNLSPGTYSVTAKSADGCISSATTATINPQPPTPAAPTVNITQPDCNTGTGTLTVLSPLGAGLTYSINGVNYQSSTTFSGINPGTYSVTVKNADNCVSAPTVAVVNPQPATPAAPTVSITQPDCFTSTGSINVTAPHGAGLTYSINGINYQPGTTFSGLAPGTYSVTVKNAAGCISSPTSATVNPQPSTPAAPTVNITQPTCLVPTGTITVTAPTGAGLTYSINGINYQAGTSFSGLAPGTYNVTAKNAAGCISAPTPATVNPQPSTPAAPTVNITQPTCLVPTGTITVTAPTGAGFTYSINGINYQSSTTFSGLAPGTYNVTAKNADGCISSPTPATVNPQPSTPAAPTVNITQPTCLVATGTITVTAPTGAGFTYSINGINYQSSTTFSGLAPGTYNVTAKNADGCISSPTPATVNPQPSTPAAPTVNITQPTCLVATGTIVVTAPTGAGFTYSINGINYQSSTTFSGLAPGTYNVTAKNAAGCISSPTPATVNPQPSTPAAPTVNITQPTCLVATGTITVTAPTGAGLTYSINGINYQSSTTFSGLAPGSYTVTVRNADGCTSPGTVAVVNPAPTSCGAGIYPTQTTCSTFKGGTATPLASLCYTKKQAKVFNVTPGVFFYFTSIIAPSTSFTVDIKQTAPAGFQTFAVHQDNQITVWNKFCGRVADGYTTTRGQAQIMVTNATAGQQYIIAVKYDAKSLIGNTVNGSPSPVFSFWTELNNAPSAGSQTSITMAPGCSGARDNAGYVNNSISAFPNPTSDLVNLNYHMSDAGDAVIRVFSTSGQLVMDRVISHDTPGEYKTELQLSQLGLPGGLYVIQVIRRDEVVDHLRIILND